MPWRHVRTAFNPHWAAGRPARSTAARRRLADLADPRRTRRRQDPRRRRMGAGAGNRRAEACGADRACWRDLRRRPRGDDRGRLRTARHSWLMGAAGMAALAPPARVAERHGGAGLLGGRSGIAARAAVRRRLGGRTGQVALSGRLLGHAAIRTAPGPASAPGGDHDAAADPASEAVDRRRGRRHDGHQPRDHGGQRHEPGAGIPQPQSSRAITARASAARSCSAR